jgi:hypothetical protein
MIHIVKVTFFFLVKQKCWSVTPSDELQFIEFVSPAVVFDVESHLSARITRWETFGNELPSQVLRGTQPRFDICLSLGHQEG